MKKSLLTMTAAVALVGAMGAGATLAYFSAESNEVKNSFAFAETGIAITLEEHAYDQASNTLTGEEVTSNTYNLLVPGMTVPKDPFVTVNAGSVDCYVVVKVVNNNEATVDNITFNTENWTKLEGAENGVGISYWQYNDMISRDAQADQVLPEVFTQVTFRSDVADSKAVINDIVVTAAATQAQERTEADAVNAAKLLLAE